MNRFDKCVAVIGSCENVDQLIAANSYTELAKRCSDPLSAHENELISIFYVERKRQLERLNNIEVAA